MGKTIRHEAYRRCCAKNCEYCAKGRQHQAMKELDRMLDCLRTYNEYKNKLKNKEEEDER